MRSRKKKGDSRCKLLDFRFSMYQKRFFFSSFTTSRHVFYWKLLFFLLLNGSFIVKAKLFYTRCRNWGWIFLHIRAHTCAFCSTVVVSIISALTSLLVRWSSLCTEETINEPRNSIEVEWNSEMGNVFQGILCVWVMSWARKLSMRTWNYEKNYYRTISTSGWVILNIFAKLQQSPSAQINIQITEIMSKPVKNLSQVHNETRYFSFSALWVIKRHRRRKKKSFHIRQSKRSSTLPVPFAHILHIFLSSCFDRVESFVDWKLPIIHQLSVEHLHSLTSLMPVGNVRHAHPSGVHDRRIMIGLHGVVALSWMRHVRSIYPTYIFFASSQCCSSTFQARCSISSSSLSAPSSGSVRPI